jgi:hypothetical protein
MLGQSPSPAGTTKPGVSPSVTPRNRRIHSPQAGAACTLSRDQVARRDRQGDGVSTEQPKISMSITTGTVDCTINLGSNGRNCHCRAAPETIWGFEELPDGNPLTPVTLKPGVAVTTPAIAWDRTRSSP